MLENTDRRQIKKRRH